MTTPKISRGIVKYKHIAYYNEIDPYCVQWLKNLIAAGHIPFGVVDNRPIQEIEPYELQHYTQCHFFAGIGGWPYALRLSKWPDNIPVWTGSCPCQPFSIAGKGLGNKDKRHLWPYFKALIQERKPAIVFGEQVATKASRLWLNGVRTDLEGMEYEVGAADLCSAGVGAPHIRQRLWWAAQRLDYTSNSRCPRDGIGGEVVKAWLKTRVQEFAGRVPFGGLANSGHEFWQGRESEFGSTIKDKGKRREEVPNYKRSSPIDMVAYNSSKGLEEWQKQFTREEFQTIERSGITGTHKAWGRFQVVYCQDGKYRRFEPGSFPLAYGIPQRVGKLRAYGNAINSVLASEFIQAWIDCQPHL